MKTMIVMLCMVVMACSLNAQNAKRPVGFRPCGNDTGCYSGEYCGFHEVDSIAVCLPDNNIYMQTHGR